MAMLLLALMTGACFDDIRFDDPARDDIPIIVDLAMPDDTPRTKSMVSGTENPISVMQLLCFDASGLYLGIRTVGTTANSYGECVTSGGVNASTKTQSGRIIARIPAGTARIHFIANRNLETPLDFTAGTSERIVMRNLSTSYTDTQQIVYWGYHMEKTSSELFSWMRSALQEDPTTHFISVKDGATPNKVYLIRDRARIQITFDDGLVGSSAPYKKVEWLVHNGRTEGLIAPYNAGQSENLAQTPPVNPWTGYTDNEGSYATVPMTELTTSDRYTLWSSDADENRTFDSSDSYQYVFEDSNEKAGDTDGRLKLILKVYTSNTAFKYLVILLKNGDDQIGVVRNSTYSIRIKSLDARGYSTLKAAVNGEEFANAPVESPRELTTVANENYILQIALDQTDETAGNTTTAAIYNTTGTKIIPFKFLNASDNTPVNVSASVFKVSWEGNIYSSWTPTNTQFAQNPANYISYNSTTECWEISVNLGAIGESNPLKDYLVIKHVDPVAQTSITRYVHIYGIQSFVFGTAPEFTKLNTTYSETVSGETRTYNVYKLSFQLPDTYDETLYPINIRMATSTLEPYSDNGYSARHGMFGVVIESTAALTGSSTRTNWNYKANSWGYWYEYSLPSMPYMDDPVNKGKVDLYFLDTRSNKAETNPTSVGLFLEIPNFGGLRSYYLAAN